MELLLGADRNVLLRKSLEATEAISSRIAANAAASETARRLSDDSVAAMKEAGLLRLLTPSRYGGTEAGMRVQCDTAAQLAFAHPSAAWVQLVMGSHSWIAAGFPTECQDEVFGDNPDVLIPGSQAPQGRATKVEGGWRLNGQWQFCSGVDHGEWVLIGAAARPLIHLMLPIKDVTVVDTWHTLGMRATGSKDVVIEDAFVPDHRSIETATLFEGSSPYGQAHPSGLYQIPIHPGLTLQLAHVVWAAAQRAVDLFVERNMQRTERYTKLSKAESPGLQMRLAESSAELHATRMLLREAADKWDEIAATTAAGGTPVSIKERAWLKWNAAYCVEVSRRALGRLFNASGAHSIYDDAEIQMMFRDVNTACHHAAADYDSVAQIYGRSRLGLEPGSVLL